MSRNAAPAERSSQQEVDLIDRLVSVNRVAKVVKGGRRFGFAALVVIGDGKGRVGYGTGKAKEVPDAVKKATDMARKSMIRVPLREGRTLHHDVKGRYGSGKVILRAAPAGTGIIAGGPMRAILEALGVQDVVAKSTGSSNPHNMVKATLDALQAIRSPRAIAGKRGKKIGDVIARREIILGGGTSQDSEEEKTEVTTAKKEVKKAAAAKKSAAKKSAAKKPAVTSVKKK